MSSWSERVANPQRTRITATVHAARGGYYAACADCGRRGPEMSLVVAKRLASAHRCPDSFDVQIDVVELPA